MAHGSEQEDREAEVEYLMQRAQDPDDPYDGHHGNDRSEASLLWAGQVNPELAERIADKIRTGATE